MLMAYRIGGSTCEITLAVPHGPGRLELLGSAELDEISGFDLDDASPADARAVIQSTVDLALQTVRSCGAAPGDLSAVLIAGGSEAVYPYVSDLLSAAFPVPVLRDSDPAMTVACGAALAVRPPIRPPAPPPAAAPGGRMVAEISGRGSLPTDSWPDIASGDFPANRPPRPPVAVATMRAGER
jgi:hypothetical protein